MKMKIRKVLSVFLAIIMLTGCLSIMPVSAETPTLVEGVVTVYVNADANDGGDGSENKPVKTIDEAINVVNSAAGATSGVIVLKSDVTMTLTGTTTQAENNVPITVTSSDNKTITFSMTSAQRYTLNGNVTFDKVTLAASGATLKLIAGGNKLVVTANIKTTGSINVYGARSYKGNGGDVSLLGGDWNTVYPITEEASNTGLSGGCKLYIGRNAKVSVVEMAVISRTADATSLTKKTVKGDVDITFDGATIDTFKIGANLYASSKRATDRVIFEGKVTVKYIGDCKSGSGGIINTYTQSQNYLRWYKVGGTEIDDTDNGVMNSTIANDNAIRVWFKGGIELDMSDFTGDTASNTRANVRARLKGQEDMISGLVYKDNIEYIGAQTKTGVTEGVTDKYNVRFIAVLDKLDYKNAGFDIVVKQSGNAIKNFDNKNTTKVYTSILANTDKGISDKISAKDLGGEYIIALTITDVPTSLGELVFEVTPFTTSADGAIKICGATSSFTYKPAVASN